MEPTAQATDEISALVPHLEQYFGVWGIESAAFNGIAETVRRMDIVAHVKEQQTIAASQRSRARDRLDYHLTDGGVAVIEIVGTITKYGSSFSDLRNGTVGVRHALRVAQNDPKVGGIALKIDSPGGTVAGVQDLADDIHAVIKPVVAFAEDLTASAAYWLASQAHKLVASPGAFIGSIGVYAVVRDWSEFFESAGIQTFVIKSAQHKGAGATGSRITDEQLDNFQRIVDDIHGLFVGAVARGRNRSTADVQAWADGRLHAAAAALELGLIDSIGSFEDTVKDLETSGRTVANVRHQRAQANEETHVMDNSKEATPKSQGEGTGAPATSPPPASASPPAKTEGDGKPREATYHELAAACPGASSEFVCKMLNERRTVDEVRAEHFKAMQAENAELRGKVEQAENAAKAAADGQPTHPVSGDADAGGGGDAVATYEEAITAQMDRGLTRAKAIREVCVNQPDLQRAMIAEVNTQRRAG